MEQTRHFAESMMLQSRPETQQSGQSSYRVTTSIISQNSQKAENGGISSGSGGRAASKCELLLNKSQRKKQLGNTSHSFTGGLQLVDTTSFKSGAF